MSQVFNPVAYQRRLNVLNTLIENNVNAKEIFKKPMLNLDAIDNDYIFWESLRNNYQNYNCKTKTQINIQEIQEMLKKGAIKLVQPNTKRLYLSSIFIVPKKDS